MWLECIGVVNGWCCKEVYRFPLLLIPIYSTCISFFAQQHRYPYFFVHLKTIFSFLFMLFLCSIANVAQRTFSFKIEIMRTWRYNYINKHTDYES